MVTRQESKEIAYIRARLIKAENSGLTDKTPEQILADIKNRARKNGDLPTLDITTSSAV